MPAALRSARSSRGSENIRSSVAVRTSSTSPNPSRPSASSTSRTRISGTEAPDVTPTVVAPSNHARSSSAAVSIRYDERAPASSATSTSRTEFDEFADPTVMTTSHAGAIFFTATWRFWVA